MRNFDSVSCASYLEKVATGCPRERGRRDGGRIIWETTKGVNYMCRKKAQTEKRNLCPDTYSYVAGRPISLGASRPLHQHLRRLSSPHPSQRKIMGATAQHDLPAEHAQEVWHTWQQIERADSRITCSCLIRHLTTLAPSTSAVFNSLDDRARCELIAKLGDLIFSDERKEMYSWPPAGNNEEVCSFSKRVALLRDSPALKAISHENFPAIHRAFLFFVWEMCEVVGIEYTDRVASAFSRLCNVAEAALTPHMSAEDRKHNAYFNRRAPGALVAIESPEALVFAQASS